MNVAQVEGGEQEDATHEHHEPEDGDHGREGDYCDMTHTESIEDEVESGWRRK